MSAQTLMESFGYTYQQDITIEYIKIFLCGNFENSLVWDVETYFHVMQMSWKSVAEIFEDRIREYEINWI